VSATETTDQMVACKSGAKLLNNTWNNKIKKCLKIEKDKN
jgi:hypothetical protein